MSATLYENVNKEQIDDKLITSTNVYESETLSYDTNDDENYVCNISLMKISDEPQQMKVATQQNKSQRLAKMQEMHRILEANTKGILIDRQDEQQTITELMESTSSEMQLRKAVHRGRMRMVVGILVHVVLPLAHGVARGIKGIRDVRVLRILQNLSSSRQALTNLIAFAANTISMNLSSVQVTNRLGPLLQLLKLRRSHNGLDSLPDKLCAAKLSTALGPCATTTPLEGAIFTPFLRQPSSKFKRKSIVGDHMAPNCCTLKVLAEPATGTPISADIIFIHGLHGSLVKTWRQGVWLNERQPVEFERPPKPPVRPPKRCRHARTSAMHAAPKQKRAKFVKQHSAPDSYDNNFDNETGDNFNAENYAIVCSEPEDTQVCDEIEYSFPAFRLRVNDNSRLLAAMLNNAENTDKKQQNSKATVNDSNYSKCWPGDWLPLDCPDVRVIAINYTTDEYLWRPLWKQKEPRSNLVQRSREMSELLIKHRVGHGHPIVYVGHSKGGLFIKQILVDAWEGGRPALTPLWRSARGVFFYSVPHRGSHWASIKAPFLARSVELLDIEKNNAYLLDLHRRFAGLYHLGHLNIEVFSFVETALTLMSVLYVRIVGVDSADPGIGDVCGIRLDHREICKPRNRDCILYRELVKMIKKIC